MYPQALCCRMKSKKAGALLLRSRFLTSATEGKNVAVWKGHCVRAPSVFRILQVPDSAMEALTLLPEADPVAGDPRTNFYWAS